MASRDLALPEKDFAISVENRSQKPVSQDEFILEQVLGLTNTSTHALDCNQVTGYIAFPAAFTLVLLDPKTNDQKLIESPSVRYISSVCFSEDGRLVGLGETGFKPYVSVWSLKDHKEASKFVIDHSAGVKAIVFHPKSPFLVVLGTHDCNIGVWDYVRGRRLAFTRWQTAPLALTIPKPGSCIIVCGHRKITLFNTDNLASNNYETNVFEDRKAVLLGRQSEYTFVDITSGKGKHEREVYTVTACGFLCEIKLGDILIDKAIKVDLHAFCVRYGLCHVFVGCCEGVVKICNPEALDIIAVVSLDQLLGPDAMPKVGSKIYLDTTAIAINDKDDIVTCIYADCSMHSWQINNFSDTVECSALLPASGMKPGSPGYDPSITDNMYKASLFRSFIGCCDKVNGSMMFDSATLAARNRQNGRLGFMNMFKDNRARYQHANAVRFSPDGKDVICGNEDGEIKVYDAASGALRRVIEAHSSQVTCIELVYDDEYQLVCSGGRDRIIFVLNAKTDFSLVQVLCDHSAAITAVRLVHNGGLLTLVSAAADNVILIRRAIPGNTLKFTVIGEIAESRGNKSFNITSDYIITGARNGNIKLFKADPVFSGKPTKTIKATQKFNQGSQAFRAIDIDPSGSFIATTQTPGQITVYHLQTGQPIASLSSQSDVTAVKFTSDLKYMVSSTSNGCTLVWRLPERMTEFMRFKQEKIYQVEMSREISYETYVSCLRVCKETTVCDDNTATSHCQSESSSYTTIVCDTEVTPSIESLSLLQMCPTCHRDMDRRSTCTTESRLSCSTCTGSFSETLACEPSSGSSYQLQSAPVHLFGEAGETPLGGTVIDTVCTRLGPFLYEKGKTQDRVLQSGDNGKKICGTSDGNAVEVGPRLWSDNRSCPIVLEADEEANNKDTAGHNTFKYGSSGDDATEHNGAVPAVTDLGREIKSPWPGIGESLDTDATKTRSILRSGNSIFSHDNAQKPVPEASNLKLMRGARNLINVSDNYKNVDCKGRSDLSMSSADGQMHFFSQLPERLTDAGQLNNDAKQKLNHYRAVHESCEIRMKRASSANISPEFYREAFSPLSSSLSFRTADSHQTANSRKTSFTPDDMSSLSPFNGVSSEGEDFGSQQSSPIEEKLTTHLLEDRATFLASSAARKVNVIPEYSKDKSWLANKNNLYMSLGTTSFNVSHNVPDQGGDRHPSIVNEVQPDISSKLDRVEDGTKTPVNSSTAPEINPNNRAAEQVTPDLLIGNGAASSSYLKTINCLPNESVVTSLARKVRQMAQSDDESSNRLDTEELGNMESWLGRCNDPAGVFSDLEDGEMYNYHCITRDTHGRLRRMCESHRAIPNNWSLEGQNFAGSLDSMCTSSNTNSAGPHDSRPWNIQCSRCPQKAGSKFKCVNDIFTANGHAHRQETASKPTQEATHLPRSGDQGKPSLANGTCVDNDSPKCGDKMESNGKAAAATKTLSSAGEEYSCSTAFPPMVQLSNSQETFYKLADGGESHQALAETLAMILKTNADYFADILNLSPSQMDVVKSKIIDSDSEDQYPDETADGLSSDKSSSTLCSTKLTGSSLPSFAEDGKRMTSLKWNNSSESQSSTLCECSERAAKKIISIIEQILTDGATGSEKSSQFWLTDKTLGTRRLSILISNARTRPAVSNDRPDIEKTRASEDGRRRPWRQFVHPEESQMADTLCSAQSTESRPNDVREIETHSKKVCDRQFVDFDGRARDNNGKIMEVQQYQKEFAKEQQAGMDGRGGYSPSDAPLHLEINSLLCTSRCDKLVKYKAEHMGQDDGPDVRNARPGRSKSAGRDGPGVKKVKRALEDWAQTSSATASPVSTRRLTVSSLERDPGQIETESPRNNNPELPPTGDQQFSGEMTQRNRTSLSLITPPGPILDLFPNQDVCLKRLKEVRQNFERGIQASSEARN